MGVRYRMTDEEIHQHFRYEALFAGFVPIYLGALTEDAPNIATRNWVPEWLFDLAQWGVTTTAYIAAFCFGYICEGFPVVIQRRLDGTPLNEDPDLPQEYDDEPHCD